ncbi:hypothetical protein KUTeg_016371 [Tegillarca granosa]|uniref:Alpha-1,4-N-acetylglucosaminyltransferase n=1 Tax=Tegillarca granosa TaxID=220873 RepID=A0ABQ9EKN1_TEGGR|nr:hypothetical protein KUTeg_016371 [Tegillarca granosa]
MVVFMDNVEQCSSVQANLSNYWQFDCKVQCPDFNHLKPFPKQDSRYDRYPMRIPLNGSTKTALQQYINEMCPKDDLPVPRLVHYIWFGVSREMKFYQFLSAFSTYKYVKPCLILYHGNTVPKGRYWNILLRLVPNIKFVYREEPTTIENIKLKQIEHRADIGRFQVLKDFGGIYMDTDSILLKPILPLLRHDFTLSIENPEVLGIGTMLSTPNATFLQIWLEHYITFDTNEWGWHSVILPYRLSKKYPSLIHVENATFYSPGPLETLFFNNFNWEDKFAMHLSIRYYKSSLFNEFDIRRLNTTLGAMARHILFDRKELCAN